MTAVISRSDTALRGRRKSRFGCRNCKLRKIKCDESQPRCTNCSKYGVFCNFALGVPDLQPVSETRKGDALKRNHSRLFRRRPPPLPPTTLSNAIWSSDGHTTYRLDAHDWALFTQFRQRTVHSLGGEHMVDIYEKCMLQKCFSHPFLMHGTLAVAAVHDRYLQMVAGTEAVPSVRESFHIVRCTSLFNEWLSQPLTEENKDPIWSGAGSLSILTFSSTTATRPEQAWPLGPPDPPSDLEWLRLGAGKMTLWSMVNPAREGSVFRPMFQVLGELRTNFVESDAPLLPELGILCGIDESSTAETNPYYDVAISLSRLIPLPADHASLGTILMVASKMHGLFEELLHQRDPVALLLLGLWYAKARKCKWWIEFRARHEIPAIYQYLKKHHPAHKIIYRLLCQFGVAARDLSP
ncbi:hypothetical protein SEUCBS140593_005982 [Sporothrix eucalyptigena]|uniref:Zn(2)-C6 fungal-type domain-containing protein n=1 Tax=Sporothrix eucalyptigena TaxID=1812306 RepID=A0ABP0C1B1_9PEZI